MPERILCGPMAVRSRMLLILVTAECMISHLWYPLYVEAVNLFHTNMQLPCVCCTYARIQEVIFQYLVPTSILPCLMSQQDVPLPISSTFLIELQCRKPQTYFVWPLHQKYLSWLGSLNTTTHFSVLIVTA